MNVATHFIRRDPAEIKPWAETCGQIRCLVEEKDRGQVKSITSGFTMPNSTITRGPMNSTTSSRGTVE